MSDCVHLQTRSHICPREYVYKIWYCTESILPDMLPTTTNRVFLIFSRRMSSISPIALTFKIHSALILWIVIIKFHRCRIKTISVVVKTAVVYFLRRMSTMLPIALIFEFARIFVFISKC